MPKTIDPYPYDLGYSGGATFSGEKYVTQTFHPPRNAQIAYGALKKNSLERYGLNRRKHRLEKPRTHSRCIARGEQFVVINLNRNNDTIEHQFNELKQKWLIETSVHSSLTTITTSKYYLRIIGLGPSVIPLILWDLEKNSTPWFVALQALTGEYNIGKQHAGRFRRIAAEWIAWGKSRRIL